MVVLSAKITSLSFQFIQDDDEEQEELLFFYNNFFRIVMNRIWRRINDITEQIILPSTDDLSIDFFLYFLLLDWIQCCVNFYVIFDTFGIRDLFHFIDVLQWDFLRNWVSVNLTELMEKTNSGWSGLNLFFSSIKKNLTYQPLYPSLSTTSLHPKYFQLFQATVRFINPDQQFIIDFFNGFSTHYLYLFLQFITHHDCQCQCRYI